MIEAKIKEYFDNPRKIVSVEPLESYVLRLTFDNGEIKFYYMKDKLQGVFSILQNTSKFEEVFLDEFGNVAWDIYSCFDHRKISWLSAIDISYI